MNGGTDERVDLQPQGSRRHPSHQALDLLGHFLVGLLAILEDLAGLDVRFVVLEVLLLQFLESRREDVRPQDSLKRTVRTQVDGSGLTVRPRWTFLLSPS